jgi:hypothetical protein
MWWLTGRRRSRGEGGPREVSGPGIGQPIHEQGFLFLSGPFPPWPLPNAAVGHLGPRPRHLRSFRSRATPGRGPRSSRHRRAPGQQCTGSLANRSRREPEFIDRRSLVYPANPLGHSWPSHATGGLPFIVQRGSMLGREVDVIAGFRGISEIPICADCQPFGQFLWR